MAGKKSEPSSIALPLVVGAIVVVLAVVAVVGFFFLKPAPEAGAGLTEAQKAQKIKEAREHMPDLSHHPTGSLVHH